MLSDGLRGAALVVGGGGGFKECPDGPLGPSSGLSLQLSPPSTSPPKPAWPHPDPLFINHMSLCPCLPLLFFQGFSCFP